MCARKQTNNSKKFNINKLKNLEKINQEFRYVSLEMGGILSKPIKNMLLQRRGTQLFKIGVVSMQGFREHMEDSHSILPTLPNHPNFAFFWGI